MARIREVRLGTMILVTLGLTACVARPGPPPVESEDSIVSAVESTAHKTPENDIDPRQDNIAPRRSQISVGISPLNSGLNPHLMADDFLVVQNIADLVLPSVFEDSQLNTDLVSDAREIIAPPGVAMRVRYKISPAAQWSDGTPITGADFIYLWENMISTPGVVFPAGYRAISDINASVGGQVVTVDFNTRVSRWDLLFEHLLPSHLLIGTDFQSALNNGIPASAGRFLLNSVDRARGVITLNRNDRFWGQNPAKVDIVMLREVKSVKQGVGMLRAGQIGFLDVEPEQTTQEALSLLPGVQVATRTRPHQMRLELHSRNLQVRRELAGAIDPKQVVRIATNRTTLLQVPYDGALFDSPGIGTNQLQSLGRAVVIAADPSDDGASAAADVIVDELRAQGVDAKVERQRMSTITSELVPAGRVDAVVRWVSTKVTPFSMAEPYLCQSSEAEAEPTPVTPLTAARRIKKQGCPDNAAAVREDILTGRIEPVAALAMIRQLNQEQALYVPLLDEIRVHALGSGILGPGPDIASWQDGLASAATWKMSSQELDAGS